jgi:hypothetical protein
MIKPRSIAPHNDGPGILSEEPHNIPEPGTMAVFSTHPLTAALVIGATAVTDAVYVQFTSAVVTRRRVSAANWSGLWYSRLLTNRPPLVRLSE